MANPPPSFSQLAKAIKGFIIQATLPLPDDLVEIIEGYLRKHEEFEESIADKCHDELLSIWESHIADVPARYGAFIHILRRLRPLIGEFDKVMQWWNLFLPALDILGQEKDLAAEGQALVLDVMTADDGNDPESPLHGAAVSLTGKMMTICLEGTRKAEERNSVRGAFKLRQLRDTLLVYGRQRPRDFMGVLDGFMVKREWRALTLNMIADYVRSQPPHLHQILETPLFASLLNCLQIDTSTTVVTLALSVLTMVLPHMPSSLVPHLPTLFNIYARLLFWERELSATELGPDVYPERNISVSTSTWEKMPYAPDFDEVTIPRLINYFTILYGLYPLNFMDYIRKPQRYLRHAEVPNADDIEVQPTEIRHASETYRQCHLLHENFFTLTIDSEKSDFGRWIKCEPAEVVADCLALFQPPEQLGIPGFVHPNGVEPQMLSPKIDADGEEQDPALLNSPEPTGTLDASVEAWPSTTSMEDLLHRNRPRQSSNRPTSPNNRPSPRDSSSNAPAFGSESPMLQAQLPSSGSQTQLQDLINSNKAIKSGLHQSLANDSVPSLSLSHQESNTEKPVSHLQTNVPPANTPMSSAEQSTEFHIRQLYRQILLLQNDLTFERFMKQQHLSHMGELRRRQVREAASEAETQNLIMANRHLKRRLEEAKKTEVQVKREAEKSRTMAKKWEADLSTKLRALREEQKKWAIERDKLNRELSTARDEVENLRHLVCEAEVRELGYKQSMQAVEADATELERLRNEIHQLRVMERDYQASENERRSAMARASESDGLAEALRMKLDARDVEIQKVHNLYQTQIVVLNAKFQDVLKNGTGRNIDALKAQVKDETMRNRAQQDELRKQITENASLRASIRSQQSVLQAMTMSNDMHQSASDSWSTSTGSPLMHRTRPHRGFSDPPADGNTALDAIGSMTSRSPVTSLAETTASNESRAGSGRREKKEEKDRDKKRMMGHIRRFV